MDKDNAAERLTQELRILARGSQPGTRLSPVRDLMKKHSVSPATVTRALATLSVEGIVETRPGDGTYVLHPRPTLADDDLSWQSVALGSASLGAEALETLVAAPKSNSIPLAAGYLDGDLQPRTILAAATREAARRSATWNPLAVEGSEELRARFAQEIGAGLGQHNVLITSGAQNAISTVFRALATPGSPVLMESPTFPGAIAAARAAGLEPVPVPTDIDGIMPDRLGQVLARTGARLVYIQPRFSNPSGAVLAADRRQVVLDEMYRTGSFLIEDDYARDLGYSDIEPRALMADDDGGHVIYLRSLTKSVAPGLRVAALAARGPVLSRLRAARVVDDFFVAPLLQAVAMALLTSSGWHGHRRKLRHELLRRRDAALLSVRRHLPEVGVPIVPSGGLHLWVRLPDGLDDVEVATAASSHNVLVMAGRYFFPAESVGPYLRLCYAATNSRTFDEGVNRLRAVLTSGHNR